MAVTPPVPVDGAPAPQPGGSDPAPAPKGGPDQHQALLRRLKKQEKELEALRGAESERQQAAMTETERWKKAAEDSQGELKALKGTIRTQEIRHRFEALANKAGALDASAAYKLADLSGVDIDESGAVVGVEAALDVLKKSASFLFGVPSTGVADSGGNPPSGPPSSKAYTPHDIKSMSKEEFAKFQAEVSSGRIKL